MRKINLFKVCLFVLFGVVCVSDFVFAGGSLPYENALTEISKSLSGPVATAVGIIALFVAAVTVIWGSDFSATIKALVGVCFTIGVMLTGNTIMTKWFKADSGNVIVEETISDEIIKVINNE